MCQGFLADDEQIVFAVRWLIQWMLEVFYYIPSEENNDDESETNDESRGPHDLERCNAGRKGICKRCNETRRQSELIHS